MKLVYILIVLLVAASMLGCVGKKATETPAPGTVPGSVRIAEDDEFGLENDLEQMDSMFNESNMDIALQVDASAFS